MFKFNRPSLSTGSVSTAGLGAVRRRTSRTATADSFTGNDGASGPSYNANRFNPVWDRLEQGSVYEDWIPRNNTGINMMYRRIYARDAIAGPSIDIWCNIPWSSFDIVGVEDPAIRRFYEDAFSWWDMDLLGQVSREFLVLGRFAGSLIYDESRGYWTGLVPHDPDFLEITPIPVRGYDPKLDLLMSPGVRRFFESSDVRDARPRMTVPNNLVEKFISQGKAPLDPLNTLYLSRKTSPYDFIGTSLLCVTGDTLVNTEYGLQRIDELHEEVQEPGEVEKVLTVASLQGKTAKSSHWVYSGEHPVIGVTTAHGFTVNGTAKHPLLTLNPATLETSWKKLSDIAIGDMVAIDYKSNLWPQEPVSLQLVIDSLPQDSVRHSRNRHNGGARAKNHQLPDKMSESLAIVLGYLASEGHMGANRMEFANMNPEVVEDFRSNFMKAFPDSKLSERLGCNDITLLTCYSVQIRSFLEKLMGPCDTPSKEIPWVILHGTKPAAALFLSSLFEGDGTSGELSSAYYTTSHTLAKHVQILLLKFGILSALSIKNRKDMEDGYNRRTQYRLTVQSSFHRKFHEVIGFRSADKKRPMNTLPETTVKNILNVNINNFVQTLIRTRVKGDKPTPGHGFYLDDDGNTVRATIPTTFYRDQVSSNSLAAIDFVEPISKAASNKIKQINDYFWDKVHTIEAKDVQPVYDLCIPETHAFVGNGIVMHNTRVVPFWAIEKALTDAMTIAARRRAGNILHVQAGIDQVWEPTPEQLDMISGLFLQADEDPTGAIVVTRNGLQVSEVRQGGAIWKLSDEFEFLTKGKMRALGINEAFLDGAATYNNVEQAKSVFVEQIVNFRHTLTHQIFTRKAEILARAHGFRRRSQAQLDHRIRINDPEDQAVPPEELRRRLKFKNLPYDAALSIPREDLILPAVHWHKELKPNQDEKFIDMLEKLEEKLGFKLPIRLWTSSTGLSLDDLIAMIPEDRKLRERIAKMSGEPQAEGSPEGGNPAPEGSGVAGKGGGDHAELFPAASAKMDALPFWTNDSFLGLRRGEAKACLDKLQEHSAEIRRSPSALTEIVSGYFGTNTQKRDGMNYILMRVGVGKKLPMTDASFKSVAQVICNSDLVAPMMAQELSVLGSFASSDRVNGVSPKKYDETWDKSSQQLQDALVDRADASAVQITGNLKAEKGISITSPSLISGTNPVN